MSRISETLFQDVYSTYLPSLYQVSDSAPRKISGVFLPHGEFQSALRQIAAHARHWGSRDLGKVLWSDLRTWRMLNHRKRRVEPLIKQDVNGLL